MKIEMLSTEKRKSIVEDNKTIRSAETTVKKLVNQNFPLIIASVFAGDNITLTNSSVNAVYSTRRKSLQLFCKAFVPYAFDDEKQAFTKKFKNEKRVQAMRDKFEKFLESGQTVYEWIDSEVQVEAKEFDLDKACKTFVNRVHKEEIDDSEVMRALLENGLSIEAIMTIASEMVQGSNDEAATA